MYPKTTFPKIFTDIKINPSDLIYTCGSCFAQEFYEKLSVRKFNVLKHPFGIVFNPLSIAQQFTYLLLNYTFQKSDLVFFNGLYHSLEYHGSYSSPDQDEMLHRINSQIETTRRLITETSFLILTFGSANYYTWNENQKIVANCHKIPQSQFTKKRADPIEIFHALEHTFKALKEINPQIQIILSVSPVRYLKDGFVENSRSKACLQLAVDNLCKHFTFVNYFPAYEIFMDDLRDYRYVKDDLVHPNYAAIDYIWSYFEEAFLSQESRKLIMQFNQFYQLLNHKVMNIHSVDFNSYIQKLKNELNLLVANFPNIDFTIEQRKIDSLN